MPNVMSLRQIIRLPDPRLRSVSGSVSSIDSALLSLMDDMVETMYAAQGVGLAAIQVAVPLRVFVLNTTQDGEPCAPLRVINPEFLWMSEEISRYQEGCLSIPDFYANVERPTRCRMRFYDETGQIRVLECDDILARVVQHEMDHLNGVLFIDHLSKLKRDRILKKFSKKEGNKGISGQ